jgi:uncharacterized protein YkwD
MSNIVPVPHRRRTRLIVMTAGVVAVLGVGFAGVASAQTNPAQRPLASRSHHRPTRPAPTPSRPSPAPSSPAPTTAAPTTAPPTSPTATPTSPAPTTAAPSSPAPTTAAPTTPPAGDSVIDQVLAHINAARTQNGLAALTLSADLSRASELHNQLMINGCGLSHQCPGEAGLGDRFTAQGVRWTSAGENIGYGSAGSSAAAITTAANGLTDSMLAEVAPNDGHRRNLLNSGFKTIGLAVDRDSKGLVWMTQDFVN